MAREYTYIVARLRALEAALPERAWFERLVRTPAENLIGSLREYYRAFEGVGSPDDFERALTAEKGVVLDLLVSLLAEDRPKLFLRAGYDFDNVRHAWKASRLGRSPTGLTPFGLVPAETVTEALSEKLRGVLPAHCERLIEILEAVHEETGSLAACEYAGEAEKWRYLAGVAPDAESAAYLRIKVDLVNIKTMIRLKRSPLRSEALETVWCEGGEIETGRLAQLFREPLDEFFAHIAATSYRRLGRDGLAKDMELWRVDPLLRRWLMETLGESRYRHFDFSPVLYHLELRDRDEEIVRRVVTGKLNRMPEEMLLERVEALLPAA